VRRAAAILWLLMFAGTAQAQLCDFLGADSLYAELAGDTVNLWDIGACGYCSSVFAISVQLSADSIVVVQTDTVVLKTTCDCLFNLRVGISGLLPGIYSADVYRQKLKQYGYPFDTLVFIGEVRFQFLPTASGNPKIESYQSSCNPSSVPQPSLALPRQLVLHQNHPNPFNPSTTIKYELPNSSVVRLSVYDMLGREVTVLVNERKDAGVHEVTFDATGLSSGVYFCRLTAGSFVQTRKFLLIR
jgi:hypothetical protein